ncbi:MAG: hypothetical protein IPJ19_14305 [Planctomycetes bacterium]|nr:hypothetical protein [Planctomycetota bacterium]
MRRFALLLGLSALLGPACAGPQDPPRRPLTQAAELDWAALVARDARVGLVRAARARRAGLDAQKGLKELRAAAWYVLGARASLERRDALLELAKSGSEPERSAALLALGELGQGTSVLLELARGSDEVLAETALLALLRSRAAGARPMVEAIAADASDPHARAASRVLLYQADPAQSQEFPAARTLLELRWRAAREFGLVDGQSWKVLLSLARRACGVPRRGGPARGCAPGPHRRARPAARSAAARLGPRALARGRTRHAARARAAGRQRTVAPGRPRPSGW